MQTKKNKQTVFSFSSFFSKIGVVLLCSAHSFALPCFDMAPESRSRLMAIVESYQRQVDLLSGFVGGVIGSEYFDIEFKIKSEAGNGKANSMKGVVTYTGYFMSVDLSGNEPKVLVEYFAPEIEGAAGPIDLPPVQLGTRWFVLRDIVPSSFQDPTKGWTSRKGLSRMKKGVRLSRRAANAAVKNLEGGQPLARAKSIIPKLLTGIQEIPMDKSRKEQDFIFADYLGNRFRGQLLGFSIRNNRFFLDVALADDATKTSQGIGLAGGELAPRKIASFAVSMIDLQKFFWKNNISTDFRWEEIDVSFDRLAWDVRHYYMGAVRALNLAYDQLSEQDQAYIRRRMPLLRTRNPFMSFVNPTFVNHVQSLAFLNQLELAVEMLERLNFKYVSSKEIWEPRKP